MTLFQNTGQEFATDFGSTTFVQFNKNRLIYRFTIVKVIVRKVEVFADDFGINFTEYSGCRLTQNDSLRRGIINHAPFCELRKMQSLFDSKII